MRILYISYNGALEPLGQSQVLPYLRELAGHGLEFTLLTFEKKQASLLDERRQKAQLKRELNQQGIAWHYLRYHKTPAVPATAWDVFLGLLYSTSLVIAKRIKVVHARSYIPALMALFVKRSFGVKFIFDMRGLWADERVDAGQCTRDSFEYKAIKLLERACLKAADCVVVLTHKVKGILENSPPLQGCNTPIEVIPCCVDTEKFMIDEEYRQRRRRELGWTDKVVLVYAGSLGGWYLAEQMVDFFAVGLRKHPNLHFLVLTQSDHRLIADIFHAKGVSADSYTILTAPPSEVAQYLNLADAGISFRKPSYSQVASSPTKLGEYLACGLPIITNRGIGDSEEFIKSHSVGVIVSDFNELTYTNALMTIIHMLSLDRSALRQHCHTVAVRFLSLRNRGVEGYRTVYRRLSLGGVGGTPDMIGVEKMKVLFLAPIHKRLKARGTELPNTLITWNGTGVNVQLGHSS